MTPSAVNQPEDPPPPPIPPPTPAELTEAQRQSAMNRWRILRPHLEEATSIVRLAETANVAERTLRRWLSAYRRDGLAGLARQPRADKGRRRIPDELLLLIEGLALRRPRPSIATVHRHSAQIAAQRGWPIPSYATVYDITHRLDSALSVLGG